MARQIIKQPNGKYCIFSTVNDDVIVWDATKSDLIDFLMQEKMDQIKEDVNRIVDQLEKGEKPYRNFTMTYQEMKEDILDTHRKKEVAYKFEEMERNC